MTLKAPSRIAIALCLLSACQRDSEDTKSAGPGTPKVQSTTVETREFSDEIQALGTVRALEAIDLSANVTETVTEVFFEDGQSVDKGAILARLSSDEETAMLEGAEINLADQEREIDRLQALTASGAVSKVRLQEFTSARDLARQKIAEARAKLADRVITAPFSGVLGFRQASVGALVSPGEVLATLDLIDTVTLDFSVPETFLAGLSPGEKIAARSDAFPDREFKGEVRTIGSRVNPVTRSALARAEFPNPDHHLRPGMLLTTRISKNSATSPSIPERALLSEDTRHFVFLIEGDEKAPVVRKTQVRIGRRTPGYVEILEGLRSGQKIIVDSAPGLRDGVTIQVTAEAKPPAKAYDPADEN